MLPDQASGADARFTLEWRPELEQVFRAVLKRTEEPFTHNRLYVAAAMLIMARQGEKRFTAYDVVEFVHANFAPPYNPPLATGGTPPQRRWIGFDWEKWFGYVPGCVEVLRSASPMDVFSSSPTA